MRKNIVGLICVLALCFLSSGCGKKSEAAKFIGKNVSVSLYANLYDSKKKNTGESIDEYAVTQILDCDEEMVKVRVKASNDEKIRWVKYEDCVYGNEFFDLIIEDCAKDKKYAYDILEKISSDSMLDKNDAASYFERIFDSLDAGILENRESDGFRRLLRLLLRIERYVDSSYEHGENTPYHIAAARGTPAILNSLRIDYCLDLTDQNGNTPIMCAVLANNYETADYLYHRNPMGREFLNKEHKSLFMLADNSPDERIRNLFSVLGVDRDKLAAEFIPLLEELQVRENFKAIPNEAFAAPVIVWLKAQQESMEINCSSYSECFSAEEFLDISLKNGAEINCTAFVYEEIEDEDEPDVQIELPLFENADACGNIISELPYGTEVKVTGIMEEWDEVKQVPFCWCKVSVGEKEGWCFGKNLVRPVFYPESDSQMKNSGAVLLTQKRFEKDCFAIAVEEGDIFSSDGSRKKCSLMDRVEILHGYDGFYEYENLAGKSRSSSEQYSRWPYYLVRSGNSIGLMSGASLAHRFVDRADHDYYVSEKLHENGTDDRYGFYVDVFQKDMQSKKIRKLEFVTPEGIGVSKNELFLGTGKKLREIGISDAGEFVYERLVNDGADGTTEEEKVQTIEFYAVIPTEDNDYDNYLTVCIPVTCNDYFAFHNVREECYTDENSTKRRYMEIRTQIDESTGKPDFWCYEFVFSNRFGVRKHFCLERHYTWNDYEFTLESEASTDRMPEK